MPEESKPNIKIIDAEKIEVDLNFEITHYQMDEKGNFSHAMLKNWGSKEIVNNQSWEIVKERIAEAKEKVRNGEISPIAYYMEKCLTDIPMLAKYTGFAKWKIKRHLNPVHFKKLNDAKLHKYADFFQISLDELRNIDINNQNTTNNI
ncbi:MAG: hypothetical protein WCH34_05625 [Bacteroidota bacterium]